MQRIHKYNYLVALLLVTLSASAQYIQVNDNYTAQQLVENVLINSSCASVSNISVSGGAFASGNSYGYFSGTGTAFPFQEGIILSTGRAKRAEGPNNSLLDDGSGMGWNGDSDLEQALGISNSVNATVLEFDFIPVGNRISFQYLLSSEEYHDDAPCRYSDGFAFLLRPVGSTGAYTNLAVVPGTNIPVKVTSVHPLISGGSGCPAQNEQYFDAFNGNEHPTNFNGQTKVLTAQSDVTPGVQYHIKLVIADEGNYRYDSAIFLGGGTFDIVTDLGPDRTLAAGNPLCPGETLLLDASTPGATNYTFYKDNVQQATGANPQYMVSAAGDYKVEVQLNPTCSSEGHILVEYANVPPSSAQTLLQCDADGDGLTTFNLDLAAPALSGNVQGVVSSFYLTQADAMSDNAVITSPQAFQNTVPNQVVYARVRNEYNCYTVSTVTLSTSANGLTAPQPLEACDTDTNSTDGMTVFNLTQRQQEILQALPSGLQLEFYTSQADALSGNNAIATPAAYTNTVANTQTLYAKIMNGADCYGIVPLQLVVRSFGAPLPDTTLYLCDATPLTLDPGAYASYTWQGTQPPVTTRTLTVTQPGTYTVTLSNNFGCTGTKTFIVNQSGAATGADIVVTDFSGDNNSIAITPQGAGQYEYSLDGIAYQDENVFTALPSGEYTVYIKDSNGCQPVYTNSVFVLDYPTFFTPNNDSYNDRWRIPFLSAYPGSVVYIYDRYGKSLFSFKANGSGWDGTYNGKPLPSDDYWFVVLLNNGRIVKGHFAMLR